MEDNRRYRLFTSKEIKNIQKITELNEEELEERITAIDDLFVFMEVQRLDSNKVIEKLDEIVTRIYRSEMKILEEDFREEIPLYLGDEAEGDFYGEYTNGRCIKINTNELYEKYLKSPDFNQRMYGCKQIIQTIAHEIQHHRQYIMATRDVSSKEALNFGKDFAIHNILGKEFYDYNYNSIETENDAEEIANEKDMEARGYDINTNINMLYHKIMKSVAKYEVNDVKAYDGQNYDIVKQDKEEIMDEVLDKEICVNKKTWILDDYPILQKVYNMDGTKKGTKQLIDEMEEERKELLDNEYLSHEEAMQAVNDSEDMYLDLIYKSLPETTKEELKQIGKKKLSKVLNKIERKFENEADELMDIGEEYEELKNKELDEEKEKFKFMKKRNNRRIRIDMEKATCYKLNKQKNVIRQARKGKVPQKPMNFKTQALKVVRPIDKFLNKVNKKIKKIIDPMINVIRKIRIPKLKDKIVKIFKENRRNFVTSVDDEITEKLVDDEITEKLVDDEITEKLVDDEVTEKLGDDEITEKLIDDEATEKLIKEKKESKFKDEINIKNWEKEKNIKNSIKEKQEKASKELKDTNKTEER